MSRSAFEQLRLSHRRARAEREGPGALLEPLLAGPLWQRASEDEQDAAIEAVAEQLGDLYQWVETRRYPCPVTGRSWRLATFRLKLGLERSRSQLLERWFDPFEQYQVNLNLLPGGRFLMGREGETTSPVHEVRVEPFLLGTVPLTQRAWDLLGGEDHRRIRVPDVPIHGASWDDVELWLAKAGGQLRFPSEAEWEYACRAGTTGDFYGGAELDKSHVWCEENSGERPQLSEQHEGKVNAFGLQDMLGQVWEWCRDQYFENYDSGPRNQEPRGDISGYDPFPRVVRGGCYETPASELSAALREVREQQERDKRVGVRVARSLSTSTPA